VGAGIALVVIWQAAGTGPRPTPAPAVDVDAPGEITTDLVAWSGPAPAISINPRTVAAFDGGFAAVGATPASTPGVWWTTDGIDWREAALPAMPTGIVGDGKGVISFRGAFGTRLERAGDALAIVAEFELPAFVRLGYDSARPAITVTSRGLAIQSVYGELFFGEPHGGFAQAVERGQWGLAIDDPWLAATAPRSRLPCHPRQLASNDYAPLVEAPAGLYAFVSGSPDAPHGLYPGCSPQPWFSESGLGWAPLSPVPVFPEEAHIYDVAYREGVFVAVGGIGDAGVVWTSADAVEWSALSPGSLTPLGDSFQPISVAAGPAGWIILAEDTSGDGTLGWVSIDGSCWDPLPDEIGGMHASVGRDRILVAGSAARPELWVGEVRHVAASCERG
jgi:hypothetical protein